MKRPVEIRVYGIQEIDGEAQKQEVITRGEYYEQNGKRFLLYEEEVEEAKKTVRTIVKESSKSIEVVKNGYISVKMSFSEGGSFNSPYDTPMGSVSLRTITRAINKSPKDDGFLWELSYSIYMDDQYIGENTLGMDVRFI
jgi:uncharacterized beta-barrel protein YwiB (DUF1934 family)